MLTLESTADRIAEAHIRLFMQLERAWKSLTWDQKTKLLISLFRGITSTTDTPVSTCIHLSVLSGNCLKENVASPFSTRMYHEPNVGEIIFYCRCLLTFLFDYYYCSRMKKLPSAHMSCIRNLAHLILHCCSL